MNQQLPQTRVRTNFPIQILPFMQNSFAGGINTSVPSELIADTEAQDILNFEYADDDHLRTRAGAQLWQLSSSGDITDQFPARITSVHYYENQDGDISVLVTSSNKLFASSNFNPVMDDITGALVIPPNTLWMWRNWQGYAIGMTHGADGFPGAAVPIKFDGTTSSILANAP